MLGELHELRGRRVTVDPEHYPKLAGITLTIVDSQRPLGSDSFFVALAKSNGDRLSHWVRDTELMPAPAIPAPSNEEKNSMKELESVTGIQNAAARFEKRVTNLAAEGRNLHEAFDLAQGQDRVGAEAYRLAGVGSAFAANAQPVFSLSANAGESFDDLAMRYASEKSISLRQAVHEVALARPDLAQAR